MKNPYEPIGYPGLCKKTGKTSQEQHLSNVLADFRKAIERFNNCDKLLFDDNTLTLIAKQIAYDCCEIAFGERPDCGDELTEEMEAAILSRLRSQGEKQCRDQD